GGTLLGMCQQFFKKRARRRLNVVQRPFLAGLLFRNTHARHFDAGLLAEQSKRVGELDPVPLHHEVEDRPAGFAAIAIENLLRRTDGKTRRLFLMERAEADVVFPAPLERDTAADQLDNVGCGQHLRSEIVASNWHKVPAPSCYSLLPGYARVRRSGLGSGLRALG